MITNHRLKHPRRQHIHSESGSKTSKDIYHVVRLDIHRGRAEQQIERHSGTRTVSGCRATP